MAEIKKYLDEVATEYLVDKVKAEDAKVLQSAKDYADGLAKNYDTAGSAATAETNAKAYVDEKVAPLTTTEALNAVDGKVTAEADRAKAEEARIVGLVEAVDDKADANAEAIAAINNVESGLLKQAKDYTDAEAKKVQDDVDALEGYVGALPEGTDATTVVDYINKKTEGIATDAALGQLQADLDAVEGDVATIKGDYLKGADKTELSEAITAEADRAKEVEGGLDARVKVVEGDYLKSSDKTELSDAIAAEKTRAENAEASLQTQINTIMNNPDAEGAINSINEFTQYVEEHGKIAEGFKADINKNKDDIAAVAGRTTTVEGKVTTLEGEMDAVEAAVATKVEQEAYNTKVAALEKADSDAAGRLDAIEAQLGTGEGSVEEKIADAEQRAIDSAVATAAEDATSKANKALEDAKAYADAEDAKIESRVDALEADTHTHANKTELDLIATGDKAKWDEAAGKAHEHENKSVLDGITAEKVSAWDAAEANAKSYADSLNTAMDTRMQVVEQKATDNATAIATKADADDVEAIDERLTTAEAAIAANTAAIGAFTRITEAEIDTWFL